MRDRLDSIGIGCAYAVKLFVLVLIIICLWEGAFLLHDLLQLTDRIILW
jgi:hypothetical protein